ncbi:unnamed protein product [Arctogadus glacialis]
MSWQRDGGERGESSEQGESSEMGESGERAASRERAAREQRDGGERGESSEQGESSERAARWGRAGREQSRWKPDPSPRSHLPTRAQHPAPTNTPAALTRPGRLVNIPCLGKEPSRGNSGWEPGG